MNNKLLFSDLTDYLVQHGAVDRAKAERFAKSFFQQIEQLLFAGEIVKVQGLGSFKLLKVDARKSINVTTGESIEIAEHYKLSFLPENHLKEKINQPFAHLEPVDLTDDESDNKAVETKEQDNAIITMKKKEEEPVFVVSDKPTTSEQKNPQTALKKKNRRIAWLVFAIAIVVLVVIAMCSIFKDRSEKEMAKVLSTQVEPVKKPETPVVKPAKPVVSDPAQWELLTTVRLKKNSRLTLLSLEYYGDKVFWVYIYEANKSSIANPNKILAGTSIRIPKANPDFIDAKNPTLVKKALELEKQYKAKFSKEK